MAKIKDWSLDHNGQSIGTMTRNSLQSLVANANFTKNMERDIDEYLKSRKKKTRREQDDEDWAYDRWVENQMTRDHY